MKPLSVWLQSSKHRILVVSVIFILLVFVCLFQAYCSPLQGGITIGGVNVAGLSPAKARKVLEAKLDETLLKQELSVVLPEQTLSLSPEECGFHVQTGKALLAARHAKAGTGISLLPCLKTNEETIRAKLEAYAAQYDTVLTQPSVALEGTAPDLSTARFQPDQKGQILVLTLGTPELHLDIEEILAEIRGAFSEAIILCEKDAYRLEPEVLPEALPETPDAAAIANAYACEPVNDTLDLAAYTLICGSYGTAVPQNVLAEQIQKAEYGETVRIPILYLPPDLMGQDVFFQDVLGSYETRHTNDQNRNHNLQLQCDTLNGLVLQPGETFSMNGVLGERTVERGYKPAPAYSGNRLVNSPGGGVCQGSTTLYNCVLLADLEVVFRACHGAKVGYVPLGLDCAVNYLTTDFQFRNNFNCPIQLKAWMEDGYMKMQILGTDEKDYYIKMETGSGEDDIAWYARSYKCKYNKESDELISREIEAYSTYYKDIG